MDGSARQIEVTRTRVRARAHGRTVQIISLALTLLVFGAWFVLLRPGALRGPATYVIVSGESMQPSFQPNDFVIALRQSSYTVGDVVVYRVPAAEPGAGVNIVHRIIGGDARTGFVVKGDSRDGPDHWRPAAEEILGKVQLHVPRAGSVLLFLRTSTGFALLAAVTTLLIALGAAIGPSRKTSGEG